MNNQKKILVAGGAGFIGSNFLRYMIEKYPKYYFICMDNLKYAYGFFSIEKLLGKPNFKFYKVDIRNREIIFDIFGKEKPHIVINFAAESHVDYSIANASDCLTTNITGVVNLMDACIKFSVDRFHQVSTDEVYGDFSLEDKKLFSMKFVILIRPILMQRVKRQQMYLLNLTAGHITYHLV